MRIALLHALKGEDMERNNAKEIATLDSLTPKFGQSSRASTGNTRIKKQILQEMKLEWRNNNRLILSQDYNHLANESR